MRKPKQNPASPFQTPEAQRQSGSPPSRQRPNRKQNTSPAKGDNAPSKCKRPMNAFMLFAKKFRVEYTQMHPGRDNRWVLSGVGPPTTADSLPVVVSGSTSLAVGFCPCRPGSGTAATCSTPEIQVTLGADRSTLNRVLFLIFVYFLPCFSDLQFKAHWLSCTFRSQPVMCFVLQSHQRPAGGEVEEDAERGAAGVHRTGQSPRRRAETAQPRLLETQADQLGKTAPTPHLKHIPVTSSAASALHNI